MTPPSEQEELRFPSMMVKTLEIWSSAITTRAAQLQRCKSTRSVVPSRTRAGVERASQAGDADAHVERPGVEKGVLIMRVDYGHLWSRAPKASDAPHAEVAGEDPPDGVRTSSLVLFWKVQCGFVVLWSFLLGKRDNERNRAVLAKELQAGG